MPCAVVYVGSRFAILTPETFPKWRGTTQQGIAHIMKKMEVEQKEWQLGRTKLFIKSPETVRWRLHANQGRGGH